MKRFPGSRRPHNVHEHVREEAVAWFIGFCEDEIDADGRERFDRWLKASPEHVQAYLQVSAFWEAAGRLNDSRKLEIEELVRRATSLTNVIELDPSASHAAPPQEAAARRRVLRTPAALAASVAFLCVLAVAALWWQRHRPVVYETGIGEERTVTLTDLSTVELDARTKIRVQFGEHARRVDLLVGQALFRVTHNPARPFIVRTDEARLRDVGTQFDVSRDQTATVVTVLEGRVAALGAPGDWVTSPNGSAEVLVSAGEQVTFEPHMLLRPVRVNAAMATAWTQGRLIFDATPLNEVIEAFNRYSPKPLTIEDPRLLSLHVSGTFDTTDRTQIIRFLSQRFGLIAHESSDEIRLSRD